MRNGVLIDAVLKNEIESINGNEAGYYDFIKEQSQHATSHSHQVC